MSLKRHDYSGFYLQAWAGSTSGVLRWIPAFLKATLPGILKERRMPFVSDAEMKTVLYIDDSADDLFLFHKACQTAGVSFLLKLVDGPDVAREYFEGKGEYADRRAHPLPDFVLLDIKMPEEDGFEVLKWIRSRPRLSQTTVALYSSSTVDKDVLRGYLTGTTFYIPKSQGMETLRELAQSLDQCLRSGGKNCGRLMKLSIEPAEI